MPTNLTGNAIASTYEQLLHVDGGPTATEKVVHGGTGVATALKVGTLSVSVDNIRLGGNTISSTDANGDINLVPNGAGTVNIASANITGGVVAGITPLAVTDGGTGASSASAARTSLGLGTLATQDANNVVITGGTVAFDVVDGRAYGAYSSTTAQTGNVSVDTAVVFDSDDVVAAGVTVVSDGVNDTRLTFADAGVYVVTLRLQLANANGSAQSAQIWAAFNGTNVPRSAAKVPVPASGEVSFQTVFCVGMAAGQFLQFLWMPSHVDVTLAHTAAGGVVPAIPSAAVTAARVG